ncbi:acetate--CoA ligase family protein [Nonomuraea sp. NPDC050310]|uniref:acetate--CoA ligase family protein n=1 Tax=Nonomuraea sp. NPDC050310 TaxID=3154935 RepID=UPI0033FDF85C
MATWSEPEVKALLRAAGIAVPRGVRALEEVAGLTEPLVLKAVGPLHKSDVGGVRLGLSAAEVPEALAGMRARGVPMDGFLVEEQAAPGVELLVGLVRDPGFGPVLVAGLGGVWAELLRDTSLRLCPVSYGDAEAMLAELRGAPLLSGYRGGAAVDVEAVIRLLLAVGGPGGLWERLDLGEFELNPVIASASGVVAVDARYLPAPAPARAEPPVSDFTALFEPRRVAVVGASTTRPGFGNMFLGFYRDAGLPVVAVHPTATEVDGVPAVPTLEGVDYALVAVPAERCPDLVRQASGVPYVQVMSGGFAEAGRPDLEAELAAAAREAGTRLLGPNCLGVYSPRGRQTFLGGGFGEPGGIALISQSGGLAGEVIRVGEQRGLRFGRVATVGNSADVTPAELLAWLAREPETTAIGLYLEDPRDGRALAEALAGCRVPVALLVGGRTGQGRRAAASHTGGLVGEGRVWEAVAAQTGTALVGSQDELIGALLYFQAHAHATGGDGVLVVGPSGGASVLAADAFDRAGLALGPLPEAVLPALRALGLGAGSSLANPLEIPVGPRARPDLVRETIETILRHHPYRDVVAHVNVQSFFTYGDAAEPLYAYAGHLAKVAGARLTLVTRNAEVAPAGVEQRVRELVAGVPVYRSMEAAAAAVAAGRSI